MSEDFLHYIWKFKKFEFHNLKTVAGDALNIRSGGTHNLNSGPDFFNSQLQINNQLWAGNVEIHVKSSDWYVHNHETDKAYDNVILHVVWEHDTDIFRKDNTKIDTLELKDYVAKNVLLNYQHLLAKKHNAINCERDFATVNDFVMNNWLERLYFERLERKSTIITSLLKNSKYNWEAVLFKLLTKNFGLNVNGDAFMSLANSLNFSIVRKVSGHQINLEALLFGQSHLLDIDSEDAYLINLIKRYSYQSHKFNLNNKNVIKPQFFRLRPQNFPTIRLSQLASLYHELQNVFSEVIAASTIANIYELFSITPSHYWQSHYTFGKASKNTSKKLTNQFVDLLIINTIIPLKFAYLKYRGDPFKEDVLKLITQIKSEQNSIINVYNSLKKDISKSALQSQALIELKENYCNKNKCLHCAIGNVILSD